MVAPIRVTHLSSAHSALDVRILHKECATLAQAGYQVSLIAVHPRDELVKGVQIRGLQRAASRLSRMTRSVWQVYRKALKEKAHIYHFHDPELIPVGILLRLYGKRVVFDVHEDLPLQVSTKYWIPRWCRKAIGRVAGWVETLGAYFFSGVVAATPVIGSRFPKGKTAVVQNFPIIGELNSSQPSAYSDRLYQVAYVGGLSLVRGVRKMIEAIDQVTGEQTVELVLAGNFDPAELESEVSILPGWEQVKFLGWQSREGVAAILGKARVGLMVPHPTPNAFDSYPIKIFEYMSAGLPVIVADFPLWRQILEESHCALFVDPMDTIQLAQAITWVFEHPTEAEEMGKRARTAVLTRYNWESESSKLIDLYRGIF